jgi:hypothetical protein
MPVPTPDWILDDCTTEDDFDDTPLSLSVEELSCLIGDWTIPMPMTE